MPNPVITWYMNPVFLASAGAFFAVGLLMLVAIYFVLTKMKPKTGAGGGVFQPDELTCPYEGCRYRFKALEIWQNDQKGINKEIFDRLLALERESYAKR